MDQTQKRPGRPSLAHPPSTCSGVPIPEEEFQRKRRERANKRRQCRAKERTEKKPRGTGTDVTAEECGDEEPCMMKTESDMDHEQGATSSSQSVAEGGASVSGLTGRARPVSSGEDSDLSLRSFSGINAPVGNQARSVDDNSWDESRDRKPSFNISNIIG